MIPEWTGEMLNVRFSGRRSLRLAAGLAVMSSLWATLTPLVTAKQVDPRFFQELKWRSIGPSRGGRALSVAGARRQPENYYFGSLGGGLLKTNDSGPSSESNLASQTHA